MIINWINKIKSYIKWRKLSKYLMSKNVQYTKDKNSFYITYKDAKIKINHGLLYHTQHSVYLMNSDKTMDEISSYLHYTSKTISDHLNKIENFRTDPKERIERTIFGEW